MSNYDILLAEAKSTVTGTAKHYIPRLYEILVKEEQKTPEDAREIIENDLKLYWSKAVIRRHMPNEAKDKDKAAAGKKGAEITNLILAGGKSVTTGADDLKSAENSPESPKEQYLGSSGSEKQEQEEPPKDNPLTIENQFLKDQLEEEKTRTKQLEEALKKTEQFKPATQVEPPKLNLDTEVFKMLRLSADGVSSFYYDTYGIELFKNRELAQLKNSGVKVFKRLYFEV
jgi:hypothetical protein